MSRDESRRRAAAEIERVGLARAGERRVAHYSQGMRQRLGIAQALLGRPSYVLLDEPTNGLDPEGIAEVRALVRRLVRDEGMSVLVSSHQLHELTGLCNRVAILDRGRLLVESATEELLALGGSRYELATLDPEIARAVLGELSIAIARETSAPRGERDLERSITELELSLDERDAPRIASELVRAGARIASFAPARATLEEIYLRFARAGREGAASKSSDARGENARASQDAITVANAPAERRAPARPIAALFGYDVRRIGARAGVAILLALPALLGAGAIAWRAKQSRADASAVGSAQLFSATDVTAFEGVGIALQAGLPLLAFVALGLGSQSISSELASGTLRNVVLRPVLRWQVVVGKALAAVCAVLAGYAVLALAAIAAARACFAFGDVSEILPNGARFALVPARELWPALWSALAAPLVPLCAFACVGLFAGTIARSAAGGLALALCAGVGLDLSRAVARAFDLEGGLLSAYLPSPLGDTSPIRAFVEMSQGISNARFEHAATAEIVPLAWLAASVLFAIAIFARRSIP
jgi:ABC-type uncharacterized transport system ATPase subunit